MPSQQPQWSFFWDKPQIAKHIYRLGAPPSMVVASLMAGPKYR